MFDWVKSKLSKNNMSDVTDEGLLKEIDNLITVYDEAIPDESFWDKEYARIESKDIIYDLKDLKLLLYNHPELTLHLDKMNEYIYQLNLATSAYVGIDRDKLDSKVYDMQSDDAMDIIYKLSKKISKERTRLAELYYRDETTALLSYLKKQLEIKIDNPDKEYQEFTSWLEEQAYPKYNPVISYLKLGVKKGYYTANNMKDLLSNMPTQASLREVVDYLLKTDGTANKYYKVREADYREIVNF